LKRQKKWFLEYFTHNRKKKILSGHLKIKSSQNLSTRRKFYFDLGSKRYLGRRDPIIGRMGYGGGSTPIVQGMDSYPVIKYIIYIHI